MQKRYAVIYYKDDIAILRFDFGQPLHGYVGGLFQTGSDRADIVLKRAEAAVIKTFLSYLQVEQGHDDCNSRCASGA